MYRPAASAAQLRFTWQVTDTGNTTQCVLRIDTKARAVRDNARPDARTDAPHLEAMP